MKGVLQSVGILYSISSGGRAAIRWYEVNETTNAVLQFGTISDPVLNFFYPSIVASGDAVLIGFSGSGPNVGQFASSYAAFGQTHGGVTAFDAPMLLKAGTANYHINDGIGRNRWGDYSATTLDPTDPTSFWTIQQWASPQVLFNGGTWNTQITQLRVTAIPELETTVLVGVGMLILVCCLRAKRRQKSQS
jgi:hypothetical protein